MKTLLFAAIFTSSAYSSTVAEDLKWHKKIVTVCWSDKAFPDAEFTNSQLGELRTSGALKNQVVLKDVTKLKLKKMINTEFTSVRTGISFDGWASCSDSANWDVAMVVSEPGDNTIPYAGLATLGMSTKGSRKSFLYLNLNQKSKMSSEESLFSTALHEFGHIAGLKHEHQRDEARADPLCHDYLRTPDPQEDSSGQYFSKYDPSSIMNYCFRYMTKLSGLNFNSTREIYSLEDSSVVKRKGNKISIRIGLSKGDIHALKCLYKIHADSPEFYRKCHSRYDLGN